MTTDLLLLIAPLLFLELILKVVAFIDLYRREEANGPKWVWALVILFMNTIGPILYLLFGRQKRS